MRVDQFFPLRRIAGFTPLRRGLGVDSIERRGRERVRRDEDPRRGVEEDENMITPVKTSAVAAEAPDTPGVIPAEPFSPGGLSLIHI